MCTLSTQRPQISVKSSPYFVFRNRKPREKVRNKVRSSSITMFEGCHPHKPPTGKSRAMALGTMVTLPNNEGGKPWINNRLFGTRDNSDPKPLHRLMLLAHDPIGSPFSRWDYQSGENID
ncbi:hypothetical protein V6N13_051639 [Hibiscus sabdariffa]|uniref:Uncharacterized protein n=1 Tax=Hibiscus sabdariffa TaxID=183260 RepID=A0ABR2T4Q2_9ROSI